MRRSTKATEYNLNNLYALEVKWKNAEMTAIDLSKQIKKAEEARIKAAKLAVETKKSYYPTDKETIASQEKDFNMSINSIVTRREKIDKIECDGMDGYARETSGTGLKGEYFDNEAWSGKGLEKVDPKINFNWNGAAPMSGINSSNYSIKWTGFIKAPFTGQYNFVVETNDSVLVVLNNKIILAHNMKTAVAESQNRNTEWMNSEVYIVQHPAIDRSKATSQPVSLMGGSKYK